MKNHVFLILLMAVFTSSCEDDAVSDPTLGDWILVSQKSNGSDIALSSCRLHSTMTIEEKRVYWNSYRINEETENCELNTYSERLRRGDNNFMRIDPVSLFN